MLDHTVLPATDARTIPAFTLQPQNVTSLIAPHTHEGWPGWVDMGGWLHAEINVRHRELNTDTVTHPSTNRTRRKLTLLTETNVQSLINVCVIILYIIFRECLTPKAPR